MIILAGSLRIAPGQRDAALGAIEPLVEATRAEDGCITYSFAFDVLDDHLVRIFEVFKDATALAAHRDSPHMAVWRAAWPTIGLGDRVMRHYDVSDSHEI